MKIAHIKSLYDRIGGVESLIAGVMPELLAMPEVEPVVILIGDTRHEEIENRLSAQGRVKFVFLRWRGLKGAPLLARDLKRILDNETVDVVHTHDMRANLLVSMVRCFRRIPWLCHMHGWLGDTHKGRHKIYEAVDRRLVALADHVLVGSNAALKEVRNAGARKSSVAWNAVAIPERVPQKSDVEGAPASAIVFTVMGRLHHGKGQDLFLKALARLEGNIEWHGVIVGVGGAEAELKALAETLSIADRVTFTGFVPDVAPWIAASDVVAVPSRKESLPLTCLEAMAMACPVVVAETGDLPQVVHNGETGFVVPIDDVERLALAFSTLARDASLRARMGKEARRVAIANHSVGALAKATVDVARGLLPN
jgi:glycosyltransferase involved in cell wall biosynthesis